jgi:Ca2+/Na+ antiporter
VRVNSQVISFDWPFLVALTWLATLSFARGRVGRVEGAALLLAYVLYLALRAFYL